MDKVINDYVTKKEFTDGLNDLKRDLMAEMRIMDAHLSRQITKEVTDTYWKIVPLMIGLMALVNGVFFIAYKLG